MFERLKAVRALDRAAIGTGLNLKDGRKMTINESIRKATGSVSGKVYLPRKTFFLEMKCTTVQRLRSTHACLQVRPLLHYPCSLPTSQKPAIGTHPQPVKI
jgi:hypothetical protein